MSDLLRTRTVATPAMLTVFDDAAVIAHACAFEIALTRAQAAEGLISDAVAEEVLAAVSAEKIDPAELADEAALAGTLAIPLVARLRRKLSGEAAQVLHRGATSQDVADTALVMQLRAAHPLIVADTRRVWSALRRKAVEYNALPAVGRTLLQDALPVAFGLRLAQAAAGIAEALEQLDENIARFTVIQFGGAAGTRAGHEGRGERVARRIAQELGLMTGPPWHSRRIGMAAIGASVALLIGAFGKLARDIALLAQNSVGEAREPVTTGRGGSSSMPHKRNPTGCQIALSAAIRAPGLASSLLAGLPQEQERGLGGWQAEAPALADLFLLASGTAAAMAVVAEGLEIDADAIARNRAASGLGDEIAESAAIIAELLGGGGY